MKKTCPRALSISVVLGSKSRFKQAFSLMEMMVVLLIISIIAAATAPMVSKKMSGSIGTGESPWVYTNTQGSIAYNLTNNDNMTAIIGGTRVAGLPNGVVPRLYVSGDGGPHPAIVFGNGNNAVGDISLDEFGNVLIGRGDGVILRAFGQRNVAIGYVENPITGHDNCFIGYTDGTLTGSNNVFITDIVSGYNGSNSVVLGYHSDAAGALGGNVVAVGEGASASANNTVAVGQSSIASAVNAVGVGRHSSASSASAVAVGVASNASAENAVALGSNATASRTGAIAIGTTNVGGATGDNSIAIGGGTTARGIRSVAIGTRFNANFPNEATSTDTIAIGQARATAEGATAIGQNVQATGLRSVAIGRNCRALHNDSIIISAHAGGAGIQRNDTTGPHQVVLGTREDTVYSRKPCSQWCNGVRLA